MNLRRRVTVIPFFTVSLLAVGAFVLLSRLTLTTFAALEEFILREQVTRVSNSFEQLAEEHRIKILDWAQWDKTYEFVNSLETSYIEEQLNPFTMTALGFSSVLYFGLDLQFRYGTTVEGERVFPPSDAIIKEIRSLLSNSSSKEFTGIVNIDGQLYFIASSTVVPNKADKPPRGYLVTTSRIDSQTFSSIAYQTNLTVNFWPANTGANVELHPSVVSQLYAGSSIVIQYLSDDLVNAYGVVRNLEGAPAYVFRVNSSREIVASGKRVRQVISVVLGICGATAILLLVWVINVFAVRRIDKFSQQVRAITKDTSAQLLLNDDAPSPRSLRFRTSVGVLTVFVIFTVFVVGVLNRNFLDGFEEIETRVMHDNIERATRALRGRLEKIKAKTIDWAQWDETYRFIEDGNQEYRQANLEIDTLGTMELKYALYFDLQGRLVEGKVVNIEQHRVDQLPGELAEQFMNIYPLNKGSKPNAGFINLGGELILVGISPILDTTRTKPSRGTMAFARSLDDVLVRSLSDQTRLDLVIEPFNPNLPYPESITRISPTTILGKAVVNDLHGQPAILVTVRSERPIFSQGGLAAKIIPIYLLVGGVLCALMTMIWVDRILISRMRRLGEEAANIGSLANPSLRVAVSGSDELSGLARNINEMLEALHSAQTELAKARDQAYIANRAKSVFIARVSHELRNPIHAIRGINQLILRSNPSKAVQDLVRMGDQAAEGLVSIVDEILDFSKAEAGELVFERICFEPREVVRNVMQIVAGRLAGKYSKAESPRVELICEVDPKVPKNLLGDPTRVSQVLVNLLTNAVKFTEKGFVGLSVETTESTDDHCELIFKVWDTGIGIPSEKLLDIFSPFKQADASVTRKYQGTGLGLSIAKQFTEGMGGEIEVESVVGEGSCFAVTLKFAKAKPSEQVLENFRLPGLALMIGDDSLANRKLVESLERRGVRCSISGLDFRNDMSFSSVDLLIIREEALNLAHCWEIIGNRHGQCTAAIISPASLELRERLYTWNEVQVLTSPVLADDLLVAFNGFKRDENISEQDADNGLRSGKRLKVLIADDTPPNRFILEGLLENAGHEVTSVTDGKDIVELLTPMVLGQPDAQHFDLVITDITMGTMDGDEATKIIRRLELEGGTKVHVPIIAVTGHVLNDEQERIRRAGMDGVLIKPMTPEMLAAAIQRLNLDGLFGATQ